MRGISFIADIVYGIKHLIQRDKEKCPRCSKKPFIHGFKNYNERYYCTHCHLWETSCNITDTEMKKLTEKGGEENES